MNFKKYIGTKSIEAVSMNRKEYNEYRGWTIPADENPEDEGFLVKYSDGYISWSPKKQFEEAYSKVGDSPLYDTALLMKSNDFKERFQAEYIQLKIRYTGLKAMLEKYKAGTLPFKPKCSYELLFTQLIHMENYMKVLEERADIEDIELMEGFNSD